MPLQPYFLFEFFINLFLISLSFFVGCKIALKYFEHKRIEFICVGITAITISEPWWTYPISSFLLFLGGTALPTQIISFVGFVGVPIGIFTWIYAITELMYEKRKKTIVPISALYLFSSELFFLPTIILDIDFTANLVLNLILSVYFTSFMLIVLITGLIFARENIIAENPLNRVQGIFMVIAFISYSLGFIISLTSEYILIANIIFVTSAISFYFGFALPERIKRRIRKEENEEINNES